MRPYFRQGAGELCLGSLAGIVMKKAVGLPPILLGRAVDTALALGRGTGTPAGVPWGAVLVVGGPHLTSAIQEQLSGIRVLRLFGRATASVQRIADRSRTVAERNLSLTRLKGGLQPIYTTVMIAGVVVIVWQGSERVVAGVMTVGAF